MSSAVESRPPGQHYCPTCETTFPTGEHCPNDGTRLVKIKPVLDPLIGRDIDGRYTIIEKIGQGGMGAVYRASQHSVGRDIAIKLVSAHLVSDPDVIKRFLREANLAARLSHPNAVQVLDHGQTDDGLFYLAMELVTGRTLDQVIKAERTFRPERIVRIGTQVCDALEVAHSLQIVHRDLKPANIMLLAHGRDLVKVLDFGLAKSVAPDQTSTTMTSAGSLLGTPAYMPPELALGQRCDGRADLYSLGCILFQLGAGRLPFVSDSAHELIAMHGTERAPPMAGVPQTLASVIDRVLEKDPNDRYQTASELREALEASIEGRYTPLPFPLETNPSLGPFPAAGDLAHARTPIPSHANPLISSDPGLEVRDTVLQHDPPIVRPERKRRWLLPVFAAIALAGAGAAAMVVMNQGATEEPPAQAPAPPTPITPAAPTTPTPAAPTTPTPAPAPVPTAAPEQPIAPAVSPAGEPPTETKPVQVVKPKTTRPKATKKPSSSTTKPAPATTTKPALTTTTTKPAPPPPPPEGAGSAKKPALPF